MESTRLFFFSFLLFLAYHVQGQKIDSLLEVLNKDISIRERIKTHNRIAMYYGTNDTTKQMHHRNMMDSISKVENDTLGKFLTNGIDIRYYTNRNENQRVKYELQENLAYAQQLDNESFLAGTYYELSHLMAGMDHVDSAFYFGNKCYEMSKNSSEIHPMNIALLATYLGRLEQKRNHFKDALIYFFEAEEVCNKIQEERYRANSLANTYKGISEIYMEMKDTSLSIDYLTRSNHLYSQTNNHKYLALGFNSMGEYYSLTNIDSSLFYFEKAVKSASLLGNEFTMGLIYSRMGDLWYSENNFKEAKNHYLNAQKRFQTSERSRSIVDSKLKLALIYESESNYVSTFKLVNEAIDYYQEKNHIQNLIEAKELRYRVLEKLGLHPSALIDMQDVMYLKDSLNNQRFNQETKELQVKYETEKKEKAIQAQNLIIAKRDQQQTKLFAVLGFLGLSVIVLGTFIQLLRKRRSAELKIKNQQIYQLEQHNKILGLSSLIQGQEEERIRIAKDLHDGLGGLLSSVKAHYGKIKKELQAVKELQVFDRAQTMMDEAVDEVRRISHNMMPPMLRTSGLAAAVKSYLDNVSYSQDISTLTDIRNFDKSIDENKALFIFRIIQELTNNVVKHAEASEIQLQMIRLDNQIQIIFEDDGKGFDVYPKHLSGVGLRSIKSRVDYLEGEIDFNSMLGEGTVVEISVPI